MRRKRYYGRAGTFAGIGVALAVVASKATKTLGMGVIFAGGKGVGMAALPTAGVVGIMVGLTAFGLHMAGDRRRYSWERY